MRLVFHWWQQLKNVYHFCQACAWRRYYGRPDRSLALLGVTGTNGKTTTCYLLDSILAAAWGRERVGMLTTVAFRIGGHEEVNETKLTTLPSRLVYQKLREMVHAGVTHAVLEMTSHALDQHRLAGVRLDGAIILNIEREHLDYHETMEAYAQAKGRIVDYLKRGAPLVVKGDDEWVERALAAVFTSPPSLSSDTERSRRRGWAGEVQVMAFTTAQAQAVTTSLPGAWNKENVLAAAALARAVGIHEPAVARGVAAVRGVPGRMEWVVSLASARVSLAPGASSPTPGGFPARAPAVLIDYAVTPGALERLYREVRGVLRQAQGARGGKIFAVLGAAGLRDRGKRPLMARAVARYADELVLTREDPWTEDEEQIFRELESGLVDGAAVSVAPHSRPTASVLPRRALLRLGGGSPRRGTRGGQAATIRSQDEESAAEKRVTWRRITDRREAIAWCLSQAGLNDVVVVTGKGAETGMAVGNKVIPWGDRKVILELMAEVGRA